MVPWRPAEEGRDIKLFVWHSPDIVVHLALAETVADARRLIKERARLAQDGEDGLARALAEPPTVYDSPVALQFEG